MGKYFAVLILAFSGPAIAESYLCLADQATAIYYNEKAKKWGRGIVTLEDNNYLVSPVDPKTCGADCDYKYEVKKFGRNTLMATCYEGFDKNGFLDCYTKGGKFNFNKVNGRYLWVHHWGYYNVLPEYQPPPESSALSLTPMKKATRRILKSESVPRFKSIQVCGSEQKKMLTLR